MAQKKGLFGRLSDVARSGANKVAEKVAQFEDRGGMRGAVERARVRSERHANRLRELLEERGVNVELGRWIPQTPDERDALHRHYRTLGLEPGVEFTVVKTTYRKLMREHHPDRHAGNADREREATRVSQNLTIAYDAIEAHVRRTRPPMSRES